jgi:hypothetical protein
MEIKRLKDFELNEGIISSIFGGIGDFFKSKKSKIESILKGIKKAKEEDVSHIINVEKEIWNLTKDNSPEYRFQITNLNRQVRTYSSLKRQEMDSLVKEANKIINNDPKLQAFFSAGLARIEADVTEKMIKGLKPYKEKTYLDQLNAEFDSLVRDATKKSEFYGEYSDRPSYAGDFESVRENTPPEVFSFIDSTKTKNIEYLEGLSNDELYKLYNKIKDFSFDLDVRYKKTIDSLRKDRKRFSKEDQNYLTPPIEKEEIRIKNEAFFIMERLKSKIFIIEKEIKSRKYGNS